MQPTAQAVAHSREMRRSQRGERKAAKSDSPEPPRISQSIRKISPAKLNAVRASHPDRIVTWVPELLCHRLRRRNDRSGPTVLMPAWSMEPRLPKPVASGISRSPIATVAEGQQPCPATRARSEEAATPGHPARAMRVFWKSPGNSPSRITGLPLAQPQSFEQLRNSPRFR
jgi:hypothetical protein